MKHIITKATVALWVAILAIATMGCEKTTESIKFPSETTIECSAGDHPTLSFTAGGAWSLSSDALWCKFITSAGEMQETAGGAGSHTITLNITDDNIKDEATHANITMKMGERSMVIARVNRAAYEPRINLYDATNTPINHIKLGYEEWELIYIDANFRFAATDFPEWVEIDGDAITGAPRELSSARLRIVPNGDRERFAITAEHGHTMTFSDENGKISLSFPIIFDGMEADKLSFTGPTSNNFGWEVSLDGKTFRQSNEQDDTTTTFSDGLKFQITARNNEYYILRFEQVIDRGIPSFTYFAMEQNSEGENGWIHFDKESSTLTVDPAEKSRYGIVMALPTQLYDSISNDILNSVLEMDDSSGIDLPAIKYDYLGYVIIEFTQCDFTEAGAYDGMYAYHSLTTLEIPCTQYTDAAVMAEYGVTEAYTCPFVNSIEGKKPGIIVDPRIEGWQTANYESAVATAEVWYKGDKLKMSEGEYYIGENKDELLAIHLWGPKSDFNDNVYILFKLNGEAKKLLVVTPPAM